LTAELERLLCAYGIAAASAGVGLATIAGPAIAEVVYTPTHTPINGYVSLDLNHDGIGDFLLVNMTGYPGEGQTYGYVSVRCAQTVQCIYGTNQIWGKGGSGLLSRRFASALPGGFEIRSNKAFFQPVEPPSEYGALMGSVRYGYSHAGTYTGGQWLFAKDSYVGLQFVINGRVHYGWARLSVAPSKDDKSKIRALLTGYAYETIANKPIITGKTSGPDVKTLPPVKLEAGALGQLARGASQIPAWRLKTQAKPQDNLH
jgi:hypothetical protein